MVNEDMLNQVGFFACRESFAALAIEFCEVDDVDCYIRWAEQMLSIGLDHRSLRILAGMNEFDSFLKFRETVLRSLREMCILPADLRISVRLMCLYYMSNIAPSFDVCWDDVQKIACLSLKGTNEPFVVFAREIDAELSRAGEPHARFETVELGLKFFSEVAKRLKNLSMVYFEKADDENVCKIEVILNFE